jgi:hypothetical protein
LGFLVLDRDLEAADGSAVARPGLVFDQQPPIARWRLALQRRQRLLGPVPAINLLVSTDILDRRGSLIAERDRASGATVGPGTEPPFKGR